MGNTDSKSTLRKNNVRTTIDVSLEKFQEKVKGIGDATEELKESFRKVLLPATELEEYLLSIPEIPGDDRYAGRQDGKHKSLESVKSFKASLSDYQTASCKSVQDFLQFAKQQMENICVISKGSQSINSLEAFAFPETDTDEGAVIACPSEKQLTENGEIKGINLKKSMTLEDTLALFQIEETLLKEKDEIREKYFQERQLHDAELEIWIASINAKKSDLEQKLQTELSKMQIMQEQLENLKKEKLFMSEQSSIKENEQKEQIETIKKESEEKYRKDLNDENERFRTKERILEQQLQSERKKVICLDIYKEENETLKKDKTRLYGELHQLQIDLVKQSLEKNNEIKDLSKRIQEKEEGIKNIQKEFSDILEQYKGEISTLKQELQSQKSKLDQQKAENKTLQRDNVLLANEYRNLQKDLTENSLLHEEKIHKLQSSIKEKEDEIAKYQTDFNDANKQHAREIMDIIQSIKENVELLQTIKEIENEKSNIQRNLLVETQKTADALKQSEFLTKRLEEQDSLIGNLRQEYEKLRSVSDNLLKDCKEKENEMQNLRLNHDKQNITWKEKLDEKEHFVQSLKKENEELKLSLEAENEKYERESERCQNTISKLELDNQTLHAEIKQTAEDHENKVQNMNDIIEQHKSDMQNHHHLNEDLLSENRTLKSEVNQCKTKLQTCENTFQKASQEIQKLKDENKKTVDKKEGVEKELEHYKNETMSLTQKLQLEINMNKKQSDDLKSTISQLSEFKEENRKLETELNHCKTKLQTCESKCQNASHEIKGLKEEKKQIELQKEGLKKDLDHYRNTTVILKEEKKQIERQKEDLEKDLDHNRNETMSLTQKLQLETNKNKKQSDDLKGTTSQLSELKEENGKLKTELNHCKIKLQTCENKCQNACQEIKGLNLEKKQIELQKEGLEKELDHYKNETVSLTTKLQLETNINKKQSDDLKSATSQLKELKKEIQDLQTQNMRNKDKIAELQKKADTLKMEKDILDEKYENLFNANEKINKELYRLKAKQILRIQLYSSCRGGMLSGVEAELMAMLRSTLENEKLELEFSPCARQSEIDPSIPTLLLCITASRLGTDVANAIQGLTLTNSMALVIFHHKDTHALPSQASDRVLTGSELSGIGGIYDFAFLSATGLHKNCQLNNNSFVSLMHFLRK